MVQYLTIFMEMHQPRRIREGAFERLLYSTEIRDADESMLTDLLFDKDLDKRILNRISDKCYLPVLNTIMEEELKISLSVSGILLEFLRETRSDVLEVLQQASSIQLIEFLCEPYHHSLAMFAGEDVFRQEVKDSLKIIREFFGKKPKIAFNTEGLYADSLADLLEEMGFTATITEGVEGILGWRSPTFLYTAHNSNLKILLRHCRLSDDIGFRFGDISWSQFPLTAEKYASWIRNLPGEFVVIGFDIETFGEHFKQESGILEFLRWLSRELKKRGVKLLHPSEILEYFEPADEIFFERVVSWADKEKDESAWLGNEMQKLAFNSLLKSRKIFEKKKCSKLWRMFLTSDHFYYMSTKTGPAGMVHGYFNPYKSPYKAFKCFIEALTGSLTKFSAGKPPASGG